MDLHHVIPAETVIPRLFERPALLAAQPIEVADVDHGQAVGPLDDLCHQRQDVGVAHDERVGSVPDHDRPVDHILGPADPRHTPVDGLGYQRHRHQVVDQRFAAAHPHRQVRGHPRSVQFPGAVAQSPQDGDVQRVRAGEIEVHRMEGQRQPPAAEHLLRVLGEVGLVGEDSQAVVANRGSRPVGDRGREPRRRVIGRRRGKI